MRNLFRGMLGLIVVLLFVVPVFAIDGVTQIEGQVPSQIEQGESDSATVRVIPAEGVVGTQHIILITGLEAGERVTIEVSEDATGSTVYSNTQVANERGIVELEIFSESDDTPGDYTVEALNASGAVIGSDSFTVIAAEVFEADISISPSEAEVGSIFTIEIAGVRPFVVLEVDIENEDGTEIFTQRLRASVDGLATIEFESVDDSEGVLTVTVIENEEDVIFEGEITVLEQVFPSNVLVNPDSILPGETTYITVTGAEPETAIRVDVVLDDIIVTSIEDETNISGLAVVPLETTLDFERGEYEIQVFAGEEQIAERDLLIDILPVSIQVTPPIALVDDALFVRVDGLRPNEDVTIEFVRDGEVIQSDSPNATSEGVARTMFAVNYDLELGMYTVNVLRLGEVASSQSIEVVAELPPEPEGINPDDITISVEPDSGPIPTIYEITVEGLPAEQSITYDVVFDGASVFSAEGTADENGIFTTALTSEETDPAGVYSFEVRVDGDIIGSVDFEISDDAAAEEDDTSESETDDTAPESDNLVAFEIEPSILRQGERIEFFVRDLEAEEIVRFELVFEDTAIYSIDVQADSNGIATTALLARDNEALGTYEMQVYRGDELIASDTFELVEADAIIDNASVTVVPTSGAQGSEYAITVDGLAAGETVELIVTLDGETIFQAEREANENGSLTVTLDSDSTDALGVYDVTVNRSENDTLTTTLEITDGTDIASGDDEDEQDSDEATISQATITIEPIAGMIGTNHVVTVTGLEPNETFTLEIEFDGEIVYSVEREADADGNFETAIAAAEGDPTGDYEVRVLRDGADDLAATLTVTSDVASEEDDETATGDLAIEIIPNEVDLLQPFDVIISGLAPSETATITIVFDGENVFEVERDADENGQITLNLATEDGDPTGTYTISVSTASDDVSADVVVRGGEEDEEEDTSEQEEDDTSEQVEPPTPDGEVTIVVEPTEGEQGTDFTFNLSGLGSNETFEIEVVFGGEVVFETSRSADASGFFDITLETDADDTPGIYTFNVLRDGEVVASAPFNVIGTMADSDDADDEEDAVDSIVEMDDEDKVSTPITVDGNQVVFGATTTIQVVEFDGMAGDVVTISVASDGSIDTVATLISPSGEVLATDDDGGVDFDPEIVNVVLPATGTYLVEVRPFNDGDTGSAVVNIREGESRTLTLDSTQTITLDPKTNMGVLTYEGQEGELISLTIELAEGEVGAFSVTAEQGTIRLVNYETFGLPQTIVLGFEVPADGTVVIRMGGAEIDATINVQINQE